MHRNTEFKEIVLLLNANGHMLKKLHVYEFGIKTPKWIRGYLGVNLKNYYVAVFCVFKSGKLSANEAAVVVSLFEQMCIETGATIQKKVLLSGAEIAKKTLILLSASGWQVIG